MSVEHYQRFGPVSWTSIFGMKVCTVVGAEASHAVLVNKDKAFSQSGWEWFIGPFFKRGLMLLDGESGYDGLHAVIVATIDESVSPFPSYEGFIFERDLPPLPEPVEPFPAE